MLDELRDSLGARSDDRQAGAHRLHHAQRLVLGCARGHEGVGQAEELAGEELVARNVAEADDPPREPLVRYSPLERGPLRAVADDQERCARIAGRNQSEGIQHHVQ